MNTEEAWSIISSLSEYDEDQSINDQEHETENELDSYDIQVPANAVATVGNLNLSESTASSSATSPSSSYSAPVPTSPVTKDRSNSNNSGNSEDSKLGSSITGFKIPVLQSTFLEVPVKTVPESQVTSSSSSASVGPVQRAINFYEHLTHDFLNSLSRFNLTAKEEPKSHQEEINIAATAADVDYTATDLEAKEELEKDDDQVVTIPEFRSNLTLDWIKEKANMISTNNWLILILIISGILGTTSLTKSNLLWTNYSEPPSVRYWGYDAADSPNESSFFAWKSSPKKKIVYKNWYDSTEDFQAAMVQLVNDVKKDSQPVLEEFLVQEKKFLSNVHQFSIMELEKLGNFYNTSKDVSSKLISEWEPKAVKLYNTLYDETKKSSLKTFQIATIYSSKFASETTNQVSKAWSKLLTNGQGCYSSAENSTKRLWNTWTTKTYPFLNKTAFKYFDIAWKNTDSFQKKVQNISKQNIDNLSVQYKIYQPWLFTKLKVYYNTSNNYVKKLAIKSYNQVISDYNRIQPIISEGLANMFELAIKVSGPWLKYVLDANSRLLTNALIGADKLKQKYFGEDVTSFEVKEEKRGKSSTRVAKDHQKSKRKMRKQLKTTNGLLKVGNCLPNSNTRK